MKHSLHTNSNLAYVSRETFYISYHRFTHSCIFLFVLHKALRLKHIYTKPLIVSCETVNGTLIWGIMYVSHETIYI